MGSALDILMTSGPRLMQARVLALTCDHITAADVRDTLAHVDAPRIVLLEGSVAFVTMQPFADAFVQRFRNFLPLATYPIRVGVHQNTAFALLLALGFVLG